MARRNTKQLILDAAIDAYAKYGYKATTCEDLAGAVGIRPSALYKHYESKREIFAAAVLQLTEKAIVAARAKATPAVHFSQQPALLFLALHAAMAGGEDLALLQELALDPLSAHWNIEKLYALAGTLVWEKAS